MAGFLLENGADLNVVSAYLDTPLDDRHLDLFTRMLETADVFAVGSMQLGIWAQDVNKGLNMLPAVVNKLKDIKGLDAAFGVFPMSAHKTAVIGRGRAQGLDIGAIMRQLGGGGHAGAGSALVKGSVDHVRSQLIALLHSADIQEIRVQDLMTEAREVLTAGTPLRTAGEIMDRTGRHALLVLDKDGGLLGLVGESQLAKIRNEQQWDKPASSMLSQKVLSVHPHDSLRHALQLMSHSEAGFLPVIRDAKLVGEITRADIILYMYDF
jgi:CBS domain-containing protein